MTGARLRAWPAVARWAACGVIAGAIHAGGAAALLARWHDDGDQPANAPAILIELAAEAAAPAIVQEQQPVAQEQVQEQVEQKSEPEPEPEPEPQITELQPDPPEQKAELQAIPKLPEKKPEPPKPKPKRKAVASALPTANRQMERAMAPAPGAQASNPNALPAWTSRVAAELERRKRYPTEAQSRGEQGTARIAFSVDRGGTVHGAQIVGSSGSRLLDGAALNVVQGAQLPPPPPEIPGTRIAITVPIRYTVR